MKTLLLGVVLGLGFGTSAFAGVTCVQQDEGNKDGWWEAEVEDDGNGGLAGSVFWATAENNERELVCSRSVIADGNNTVAYESEDGAFYLFLKDIDESGAYGKLWLDGCDEGGDADKVKMDCEFQ